MSFQCRKVAAILLALMATPLLRAASAHTWVGGNGNDSNAGTQTSPYATFATAVNNTTPGGLISVATAGDFGAVTITKSVTIDGGGIGGTITFTGGDGLYVNAGTSDTVIVRHLTINGLGVGSDAIFLGTALNFVIEDCLLVGFTQIGIGLGSISAANVVIKNTTIVGGTLGVRTFQSNGGASLDVVELRNVTITGASQVAVFSRNGVMDISDSVLTQSLVGVEADTSAYINVTNSVISFNATDEQAFGATIYVDNNNTLFANNGLGGAGGGPQFVTRGHTVKSSSATPVPPDKPRPHHQ